MRRCGICAELANGAGLTAAGDDFASLPLFPAAAFFGEANSGAEGAYEAASLGGLVGQKNTAEKVPAIMMAAAT